MLAQVVAFSVGKNLTFHAEVMRYITVPSAWNRDPTSALSLVSKGRTVLSGINQSEQDTMDSPYAR